MKFVWTLLGTAFAIVTYANADNTKSCEGLIKCLQRLQDGEKLCETKFPNSTTTTAKPSSNTCKQPDIEAKLKQKKFQQHNEYLDCLKSRKGDSFSSFKRSEEKERCEEVVSDLDKNSSDSSEHSRKKRAVSNSTTTDHHSNHGQTQVKDENKSDKKEVENKHHDHHDHGDHGHSHHGHGTHGHGPVDEKKACLKKLSKTRSQCRILTKCCTETKICSLKGKLTKTYTELTQLQLDLSMKEHDCKKSLAQKQTNSTSDSDSLSDEPSGSEEDEGMKFIKYMLTEAEDD